MARRLVGRVVNDTEIIGAAHGVACVRSGNAAARLNLDAWLVGELVVCEVARAARLQEGAPAGDVGVRGLVVRRGKLGVRVDGDRPAVVARCDAEAAAESVAPA